MHQQPLPLHPHLYRPLGECRTQEGHANANKHPRGTHGNSRGPKSHMASPFPQASSLLSSFPHQKPTHRKEKKQNAISIEVTQRGDFGDFRPFRVLSPFASNSVAACRRRVLERSPHVLKQQLDIMMTRHRMLRNHAMEPSSKRCSTSTTFTCVPGRAETMTHARRRTPIIEFGLPSATQGPFRSLKEELTLALNLNT